MNQKWKLKNRRIVVTGGSQGIGAAIVTMLADEEIGAEVWIADLPAKRAQSEALAESFLNVFCVDFDVTAESSVKAAIEKITRDGRPVYGLVNNAGIVGVSDFMAPLEQFREQIEVNTIGSIRVAQAVIPGMLEAGEGVIVQIASLGSLLVPHERAAYTVSKHGALAIPRLIAEQYAKQGIRSVGICPNRVSVPAALARANKSPADYADMTGTQASGEMLEPDEVAWVVLSALMPGMKRWNGDIVTISDGAVCSLRKATFASGDEPVMPR